MNEMVIVEDEIRVGLVNMWTGNLTICESRNGIYPKFLLRDART